MAPGFWSAIEAVFLGLHGYRRGDRGRSLSYPLALLGMETPRQLWKTEAYGMELGHHHQYLLTHREEIVRFFCISWNSDTTLCWENNSDLVGDHLSQKKTHHEGFSDHRPRVISPTIPTAQPERPMKGFLRESIEGDILLWLLSRMGKISRSLEMTEWTLSDRVVPSCRTKWDILLWGLMTQVLAL